MNIVNTMLGIELVNGKIKPNNKHKVLKMILAILFLILCLVALIYSICVVNLEFILISIGLLICFGYLLLISPLFQNSNNYYIEFVNKNQLKDFKLYYKNKLVKIDYIVANDGRIAFKDNSNKLNCISYEDNHKMSNFTKYRVINYFSKWLLDNNLMSNEVTVSFENKI